MGMSKREFTPTKAPLGMPLTLIILSPTLNFPQYLLDSFFIGKPLVDAGADDAGALSVQYADDTDAIDVQALTRRVPQEVGI
eukprot:756894-Amorphochlora_amoeboformis.AAC.1